MTDEPDELLLTEITIRRILYNGQPAFTFQARDTAGELPDDFEMLALLRRAEHFILTTDYCDCDNDEDQAEEGDQ